MPTAISTTAAELDDETFARFQQFIYETAGIRVADHKRTLLSNRIRPRVAATRQPGFAAYFRLLTSPAGRAELPRFLDEVTTNETYFFRDPRQFDWFRGEFLPEFCRRTTPTADGRRKLRIWSAACSTGEEPYSIALCLAEKARQMANLDAQIAATDLSDAVLRRAKQALYEEHAVRNVSDSQKKRFFLCRRDGQRSAWELRLELRQKVTFRRHNLLEPMLGGPFHCVWVKNVLIYFDAASKQRVVDHVLRSIVRGGYLVTGPAEGIYPMLGELEMVEPWLFRRPETGDRRL